MKKKSFPRHERELMIVEWFAIRIQNGNQDYATMPAIARGLGLEPSTHLAKILNAMVDTFKLERREVEKPGRWKGYEYMLYPGTYTPPRARQIVLRFRGQDVGKLELWS